MSRVLVNPAAIADLAGHVLAAADGLETGGVLLGVDEGLGGDFLLWHCGDAGPAALRRRNRFSRDVSHAQRLADAARAADGSAWIGEWHTHLDDLPMPSNIDLRTYRQLLDDPDTQLTRLLAMIVLADETLGWHRPVLHAWSFTGTVLRQLPVTLEDSGEAS